MKQIWHIIILALIFYFISFISSAQISIETTYYVGELIEEIFPTRHPGILISNVNITHTKNAGYCKFQDSSKTIFDGIFIYPTLSISNDSILGRIHPDIQDTAFDDSIQTYQPTNYSPVLEFDLVAETDKVLFEYFCLSKSENADSSVFIPSEILVQLISSNSPDTSNKKLQVEYINQNIVANETDSLLPLIYLTKPIENDKDSSSYDSLRIEKNGKYWYLPSIRTMSIDVVPLKKYHLCLCLYPSSNSDFNTGIFLKSRTLRSKNDQLLIEPDTLSQLIKDLGTLPNNLKYDSDSANAILSLNFNYSPGDYAIDEEYFPELIKLYEILKKNLQINLEIISYVNQKTNPDFCLRLSEERARYLAYYFLSKGINITRVNYKGAGHYYSDPLHKLRNSKNIPNTEVIFINRR